MQKIMVCMNKKTIKIHSPACFTLYRGCVCQQKKLPTFMKSGNGNFYINGMNVTREKYESELRWYKIESKLDKVLDEIKKLKNDK